MDIERIFIEGPVVIRPKVFFDERGYFFEPFNKQRFEEAGIVADFVQDNQSLSQKGALRGLHFQAAPYAQGKLVRVVRGAVLDVIVDIRKNSPTYGKHFDVELSEKNFTILWIPEGFAHGFATLEDNTIFEYKCTNFYHKPSEGGIRWDDKTLNISWGISDPLVSEKDRGLQLFNGFTSPF